MKPSFDLLARAGNNTVATASPLAVALLVVIAFDIGYGAEGAAPLGSATSVFGAAVLLSVGCAVVTLRTVSTVLATDGPDAQQGLRLARVIEAEFRIAWIFSTGGLVLATLLLAVVWVTSPQVIAPVALYLLGAVPWIVIVPHSSVTNGAFQALNRDSENARISVVTSLLQVTGAVVVLAVSPPLTIALAVVAGISSACAILALAYRMHVLRALIGHPIHLVMTERAPSATKAVAQRVAAGVDGAIYLGVFLLATALATRHSLESGAAVALAVAVMRLLIIPIKQLGLVGGRFIVRGKFRSLEAGLSVIRWTAALPCSAVAGCVLIWGVVLHGIPPLLAVVLAAQLLLEPVAGVQFAALKVAIGPRAGVILLVLCYCLLAPTLLLSAVALGYGEAWQLWGLLLAVRMVFAAGIAVVTRSSIRDRNAEPATASQAS